MRGTTYINRLSLVAAPDSAGGVPEGEKRLFEQAKNPPRKGVCPIGTFCDLWGILLVRYKRKEIPQDSLRDFCIIHLLVVWKQLGKIPLGDSAAAVLPNGILCHIPVKVVEMLGPDITELQIPNCF